MKCTDFENIVNDFIDDELDKVSSEDMKSHIDECEACKELYEELLELKVMLSNVEELDLPENFSEELHEKLVEVSNEKKVISLSDRFKKYKVIASVAAVVLISVVAIRATDISFKSGSDAANMATNEAFTMNLASDMPDEEMATEESYEVADESLPTVEEASMAEEAENVSPQVKMLSEPIVSFDIATREEVTIEVVSPIETVNTYLTDHAFIVTFNENELSVLTDEQKVEEFIHDIKANFNILSEYYVDHYEEIEDMKLLAVNYEDSLLNISNRIKSETNNEEKVRLENELEYVSGIYDEVKVVLKQVSINEGLTKVILRVLSE